MKIAPVLAASMVLGLVACSSSSSPSDSNTSSGAPDDNVGGGDNAAVEPAATNPDGVPYPKENIGTLARKGSTPGNRIANFAFLGYPNADKSEGLKRISLADYFDPTGTKYKIIHIQAAGVWCSVCQAETKTVVPMKDQLQEKGAVWLVSLAEGPSQGTPSKQADLDGWITRFKSPFTHWLDPGNKNLGPFYDATALPWNANIDATTMEILTAGTGGVTSPDGIVEEIDKALQLASTSKLRTGAQ